jgi:hypothetical protein
MRIAGELLERAMMLRNEFRTSWQEAPEELIFLSRKPNPPGRSRRERGSIQEGPRKIENVSSDTITIGSDA